MTGGTIVIRQGTIADYPAARAVLAETLTFHCEGAPAFFQETDAPPPPEETIARLLQDGSGTWFLALDGETVIGFVTIRMRAAPYAPYHVPEPRAIVDSLGIRSAWRRRGIGRQLMDAAHAWAREQGLCRVVLSVWAFNRGAQVLYASLGYEVESINLSKAI
jgi:ribosomal protein S18 acetylase RimI-like enzyme